MINAPLDGVRMRAELYKNIQAQSKLDNIYKTSYNLPTTQQTGKSDTVIPGISTIYTQASGINIYEQGRTANDLHVQLMETKSRSLQDLTEKRLVEMKLDQVVQENEKLKQKILQMDGELQAAIRQCEELSQYKDAKTIIEDNMRQIEELGHCLAEKEKQIGDLQLKLIDQQNENRVLSIGKHKQIEELIAINASQSAQLKQFELENVPGLHRQIETQEIQLKTMETRVSLLESSGKALKAEYEDLLLSVVEEFNKLHAWMCNQKNKGATLGNVTNGTTTVSTSMGTSLRYGDLTSRSVDLEQDLLVGQLPEGIRQTYYKLGSSSNPGPLSRNESLVREVCVRLARVLDDVQQFSQMNKEIMVTLNKKDSEILKLTKHLEDSERQISALQSHMSSKDAEIQESKRVCCEFEDKLSLQEAELASLRSISDEFDGIKIVALKLVDQLSLPDTSNLTSSAVLKLSSNRAQLLSHSGSFGTMAGQTDTRIRYASSKGIDVRSILIDTCLALQDAQEAKNTAALELQSLETRLRAVSDDLLLQQNKCQEIEQKGYDCLETLRDAMNKQIRDLELELKQTSESYAAQITSLTEDIAQRQQKLSVFAFVIYALCKVIEFDRYSLRRIILNYKLLLGICSHQEKAIEELKQLTDKVERSVHGTIVIIDPATGTPIEQENEQYLSILRSRREIIKKRKKQALIHVILFCSYLYSPATLIHGPRGSCLVRPRTTMTASLQQSHGPRDDFFVGLDRLFSVLNRNTIIPVEFYGLSTNYSSLSCADAIQMDGTIKEKDLIGIQQTGSPSILELMSLPSQPSMENTVPTPLYLQAELAAITKLTGYLSSIFTESFMFSSLFDFSNRLGKASVHITSISNHYTSANAQLNDSLPLNLCDLKLVIKNLNACFNTQVNLLMEARMNYTAAYQQALTSQGALVELENLQHQQAYDIAELTAQVQALNLEKSRLPTEEEYVTLKAENASLTSRLRDATNMLNAERSLHNTLQQEREQGLNQMTLEIQTLKEEKSRLSMEVEELTLKLQRSNKSLDSFEAKPVQSLSKESAKDLLSRLSGDKKPQRSLSAAGPGTVRFADTLPSDSDSSILDQDLVSSNTALPLRSTHDSICLADIDTITTPNSNLLPSSCAPPKPTSQAPSHPPLYPAIPASHTNNVDLIAPDAPILTSNTTDYSRLIKQYDIEASSTKPTEAEEIESLNRQYINSDYKVPSIDDFSTSQVADLVNQFNVHKDTDKMFQDSTLRDANITQYIENLTIKQ